MSGKTIIEPGFQEKQYWRDVWRYRELLYILSWRDIKVRYKQTEIGALWSIIKPLLSMIIFTLVLHRWAKISPGMDVPYGLMVYVGLLPWTFFSTAVSEAGNSVFTNSGLITKVYFPRVIIPLSSNITSFIDFIISFIVLAGIYAWYQFLPDWRALFLPLFIVLCFALTAGLGLLSSALFIRFRDLRHLVPFLLQAGLYITPVAYNSNIVPEQWRWLYILNPMTGIVEGFRWCLLAGQQPLHADSILASTLITILLLLLGINRFRANEKSFADII
jgi:lipopolysaccharide transport system permease protein